jgi:hypothetical protein
MLCREGEEEEKRGRGLLETVAAGFLVGQEAIDAGRLEPEDLQPERRREEGEASLGRVTQASLATEPAEMASRTTGLDNGGEEEEEGSQVNSRCECRIRNRGETRESKRRRRRKRSRKKTKKRRGTLL